MNSEYESEMKGWKSTYFNQVFTYSSVSYKSKRNKVLLKFWKKLLKNIYIYIYIYLSFIYIYIYIIWEAGTILATESPLKMMKNAFHFISNVLFVLNILKI